MKKIAEDFFLRYQNVLFKIRFCIVKFFIRRVTLGNRIKIWSGCVLRTSFGGTITIGDDTELLPGVCLMTYGGDIKIGHRCSINPYTVIYGHGNTKIGNDVLIAGHCMIVSTNHNFNDRNVTINQQGRTSLGIVIEDDVWIGGGVRILDGIKIGQGAVIAAGAVVNRDVPEYSVYAGVPARLIKMR